MRASKIELYLEKVSAGDGSYMERLCQQLADRLLLVPIHKQNHDVVYAGGSSSAARQEEKFKLFCLVKGKTTVMPVFTTQDQFKNWCAAHNYDLDFLSLLGADVCMAVANTMWIVIDPHSRRPVELTPDLVSSIAQIELADPQRDVEQPIIDPTPLQPEVAISSANSTVDQNVLVRNQVEEIAELSQGTAEQKATIVARSRKQTQQLLVSPELFKIYEEGRTRTDIPRSVMLKKSEPRQLTIPQRIKGVLSKLRHKR